MADLLSKCLKKPGKKGAAVMWIALALVMHAWSGIQKKKKAA